MKILFGLAIGCLALSVWSIGVNVDTSAPVFNQASSTITQGHPITLASKLRQTDQFPDDDSPRGPGSRSASAGDQLALIIEEGLTRVCQPRSGSLVCAIVEAPLPQDTTVTYWNLPGGNSALSYTRKPGVYGVPDPHGRATLRFQAAFNGAAKAVLSTPVTFVRNNVGSTPNAMVCENEDCIDDDKERSDRDGGADESSNRGGGALGGGGGGGTGGGGGGGGSGGGKDGDGSERSDIPIVVVRGIPDAIDSIPVITTARDPFVETFQLPPRHDSEDIVEVFNPCVVSPLVTVCIRGKRPPPPPDEVPLPNGALPWFPQGWCNWSHIFCTAGQEPRDNDRGIGSGRSGKTKAELDEICVKINIVEIDVCKANFPRWRSSQFREFNVCMEAANKRMYACFDTADLLTDHGQHPAP